jgi:hypothetical protein
MEIIKFHGDMHYLQWYSPLGDMISIRKIPPFPLKLLVRDPLVVYKEGDQYVNCAYIYEIIIKKL